MGVLIMRKWGIWAAILLCLATDSHAGELIFGAGPLVDTNVAASAYGGRARFVFDVQARNNYGRVAPYFGIETLFGDHAGNGIFNPVAAKWTVGVRIRLLDTLYVVAEHYSRHAIDGWRDTEKFTSLKLEHRFTWGP
ncbi:hypothetical protein [Geobacter sp.]|uniref:hypothetical protein n=1 Tax=Geobacter sp. TaxID=46610 RepID=UPI002618662B|nr:hypothetical protein [Geobacter sp.]